MANITPSINLPSFRLWEEAGVHRKPAGTVFKLDRERLQ